MRVEREFLRDHMNSHRQEEQPEYLGAYLEGERRLVLVQVDPAEPWAAFRRMRSVMRQTKTKASVDLFSPAQPLEHEAKVIPLRRDTTR